jgi:hypothetical protein
MNRSHGGRIPRRPRRRRACGTRTNVTDGEESGVAGLEREWGAAEGVPARVEVCLGERAVSQDEAPVVEGSTARQPR